MQASHLQGRAGALHHGVHRQEACICLNDGAQSPDSLGPDWSRVLLADAAGLHKAGQQIGLQAPQGPLVHEKASQAGLVLCSQQHQK